MNKILFCSFVYLFSNILLYEKLLYLYVLLISFILMKYYKYVNVVSIFDF